MTNTNTIRAIRKLIRASKANAANQFIVTINEQVVYEGEGERALLSAIETAALPDDAFADIHACNESGFLGGFTVCLIDGSIVETFENTRKPTNFCNEVLA